MKHSCLVVVLALSLIVSSVFCPDASACDEPLKIIAFPQSQYIEVRSDVPDEFEDLAESVDELYHAGDKDGALRFIEGSFDEFHGHLIANMLKGAILASMKRYDDALLEYDKAISVNPRYELAYIMKAGIYRNTGRPEPELAMYDRLIEMGTEVSWYIAEKARYLIELERFDEAISTADRLPDTDEVWITLGSDFERHGQLEKAIYCYGHTVDGYYYDTVGRLYCRLGRGDEFVESLDERLKGADDDQAVNLYIAKAYTLAFLGRYQDGLETIGRLNTRYPVEYEYGPRDRLAVEKARLLVALGRNDEAVRYLSTFVDENGDPIYAPDIAAIYNLEGDTADVYALADRYKDCDDTGLLGLSDQYAYALMLDGRYDELIDFVTDEESGGLASYLAYGYMKRGAAGDGKRLAELLGEPDEETLYEYYLEIDYAQLMAVAGEREKMLQKLKAVVEGFPFERPFIRAALFFEEYRNDQEFVAIVGE